ncbi:hypothetical protein Lal_00042254 [Lupinus albus]|nr:hypothetical protein Lal_00042254 [Lupinus albus]
MVGMRKDPKVGGGVGGTYEVAKNQTQHSPRSTLVLSGFPSSGANGKPSGSSNRNILQPTYLGAFGMANQDEGFSLKRDTYRSSDVEAVATTKNVWFSLKRDSSRSSDVEAVATTKMVGFSLKRDPARSSETPSLKRDSGTLLGSFTIWYSVIMLCTIRFYVIIKDLTKALLETQHSLRTRIHSQLNTSRQHKCRLEEPMDYATTVMRNNLLDIIVNHNNSYYYRLRIIMKLITIWNLSQQWKIMIICPQ